MNVITILGSMLILTNAATAPVDDRIGYGSVLTFTRDVEFGRSRQQTFCDGRPVGLLAKLSLRTCCDLVVRGVARDAEVHWARGPRTVSWINWNFTRVVVDGSSGSSIRCHPNAVVERVLRKAFGDYLEIQRVPPADWTKLRGPVAL